MIPTNKKIISIATLGFTAPLFNLRIIGSISIFDVTLLLVSLLFLIKRSDKETACIFLAFCLIAVGSEINGVLLGFSGLTSAVDSLNIFLRYIILLIIIPHLSYVLFYKDRHIFEKINLFYRALSLGYLIVLFVNVVAIQTSDQSYFLFGRFSSIYGNPNTAALVINMMTVPLLYQVMREIAWVRILAIICLLLSLYSLIFTGSFSGMLIQSLIFMAFILGRLRHTLLTLPLSLGLGFIAVSWLLAGDIDENSRGVLRFFQFLDLLINEDDFDLGTIGSASERLSSIITAVRVVFENPSFLLVGIGFGGVENLVYEETGHPTSIHFSYLQMTISVGVIGAFTYMYFFLRVLSRSLQFDILLGLSFQFTTTLIVFLALGLFIPHTYMGFYFAPLIPIMGLPLHR